MQQIITRTRHRFIAIIVLVVVFVVSGTWLILQTYNQSEIASKADISEIHSVAQHNDAFGTYLEEQKEFEAHFITLASAIKEQEADRVTSALALTSVVMVIAGVIVAYIAARKLVRPVTDAYESQERFIQDAAHELRNPLAAMTIALQQAESEGKKGPLITTFKRQTKRLISINEDLLFLERRNKHDPVQLNTSELLADIVEELQPIAARKNITINLQTDNDIVKTMATSDYVRLAKNIISNAIKYSYKDGTVYVKQTRSNKSEHLVLVVRDEGIGIPSEDQSQIGSRFFRASNTGDIPGTGLGLAIVYKILNIYGGSIRLESEAQTGTTVTVKL